MHDSTPSLGLATLVLCFETLGAGSTKAADYATIATNPKAQPASAGLLNDWLREQSPSASAWDVGGQFRVRYEAKEHAGSFPNNDFLRGLDNSNEYFLFRTKVHLG